MSTADATFGDSSGGARGSNAGARSSGGGGSASGRGTATGGLGWGLSCAREQLRLARGAAAREKRAVEVARLATALGAFEEAHAALESIGAASSVRPAVAAAVADLHFAKGEWSGVVSVLTRAAEHAHGDAAAEMHALLGIALVHMGSFESGGSEINAAVHMSQANAMVMAAVAFVKRSTKEHDAAIRAATAGVSVGGDYQWAAMLELARAHEAAGSYTKALTAAGELLRIRPGCVDALLLVGGVYAAQGLRSAATTAFKSVLQLRPADANSGGRLAIELITQRRFTDASEVLSASVARLDSSETKAWVLVVCASKFLLQRQFKPAFRFADAALQSPCPTKTRVLALSVSGEAQAELHQRADAEHRLREALRLDERCDSAIEALANLLKDQGRFVEAQQYYERALIFGPGRDVGGRGGAGGRVSVEGGDTSRMALEVIGLGQASSSHVFNLAQLLEYRGLYAEGIHILRLQISKTSPAPKTGETAVNHNACVLLLVKLLYSGLEPERWHPDIPPLQRDIERLPKHVELAIRAKVSTHWAYAFFFRRLAEVNGFPQVDHAACDVPGAIPRPTAAETVRPDSMPDRWQWGGASKLSFPLRPLFALGDSHIFSYAWRTVRVAGEPRLIVPRIATGLKAWHLRHGTEFLTHANLDVILESMPDDSATVLFSAGEIDCREGVGSAVRKGKYRDLDSAVAATVDVYVDALCRMSTKRQILVLPVNPPAAAHKTEEAEAVALFNEHLRRRMQAEESRASVKFLDFAEQLYEDSSTPVAAAELRGPASRVGSAARAAAPLYGRRLRQDLDADGTHMTADVLPLLQEQLDRCC